MFCRCRILGRLQLALRYVTCFLALHSFTPPGLFCDALARDAWLERAVSGACGAGPACNTTNIVNNALVEGSVLYVIGHLSEFVNQASDIADLAGGVDGCRISGGFQENAATLAPAVDGLPEVRAVQGGGITLHGYTKYFRITNNNIVGNAGSYGGGIRVGTPFLDQNKGDGSSFNLGLTISGNQILYNGGFNLAGGTLT